MKQYIIVSFLQKPVPKLFKRSDWPLHVTLVVPFTNDLQIEEMNSALEKTGNLHTTISTSGKSKEMFGYKNETSVTELRNTEELKRLHTDLLDALLPSIILKSPQFSGSSYRPHVTDQSSRSIQPGDEVVIDSLSLVELEGSEGRVISTVKLS